MDDMASSQVLRIRLHNQEGEYVLVEVTSNGPSPLDLRLLATEGEFPYVAASAYISGSLPIELLLINEA